MRYNLPMSVLSMHAEYLQCSNIRGYLLHIKVVEDVIYFGLVLMTILNINFSLVRRCNRNMPAQMSSIVDPTPSYPVTQFTPYIRACLVSSANSITTHGLSGGHVIRASGFSHVRAQPYYIYLSAHCNMHTVALII